MISSRPWGDANGRRGQDEAHDVNDINIVVALAVSVAAVEVGTVRTAPSKLGSND